MSASLYEAVVLFAPVEWARAGTDLSRPPFLVWRFVSGHDGEADRIAAIVTSFPTDIEWCAYHEGRNWVIEPKSLRDFREQGGYRVDVEASAAFARLNPALIERMHANAEVVALELRRIAIPH
jgi:hypothetical protein